MDNVLTLGDTLLRADVITAIVQDPVSKDHYEFTRISDTEFQLGRIDDIPTNYTLEKTP